VTRGPRAYAGVMSAKIHSPPTALALFISAGRRALSVISQEVRSFKRSSSGGKVKPGKAFNKGGLSAARMQYDSSSDEEDLAPKTKGKLRYVPSRWLCECARGLRLLTLTHSTRDGTHTSHPRLFRQRAWMRASARGLTAGILKRRACAVRWWPTPTSAGSVRRGSWRTLGSTGKWCEPPLHPLRWRHMSWERTRAV
jgi:hypothetical protein